MDVSLLILDIAAKLNTVYKVTQDPARLLTDAELAKALADVADEEPALKKILNIALTAATPAVVRQVSDAITLIQKNSNLLKDDGFFGKGTLKDFLTRNVGHFPFDRLKPEQKLPPGGDIKAIVYFIKDNKLPSIQGLTELDVLMRLSRAFSVWQKHINLIVRQTGIESEANVIVSVGPLPPPFNLRKTVVAVGDQGPPNGRQLSLIFDFEETWTEKLFIATAAHEIGHILGLDHLNGSKPQLMNTIVREELRTPQDVDIAEAVKIWGKATG